MRVLVLDTIHGGCDIAKALRLRGDEADAVDVYRGSGFPAEEAAARSYDLVTAPVHLNPAHPLLGKATVVSHHEMVRDLVSPPRVSVEITGARGKTTTAFALASLMSGCGILHTSSGTFVCPEMSFLRKKSITPASVIDVCADAERFGASWLIAEESAGVAGFGTLGVLTSADDYPIAAGARSALAEKCRSLERCAMVVVPRGVPVRPGWNVIEDMVSVTGDRLFWEGGELRNPLLTITGYRAALSAACAAGLLLGLPVERLADFPALAGRMCLSEENGIVVLDNANSGTNADTTIEAAGYLRRVRPGLPVILVIGMEYHAVCEGFPGSEISRAVAGVAPARTVLISGCDDACAADICADAVFATLAAAKAAALDFAEQTGGCVLLAAKTWR